MTTLRPAPAVFWLALFFLFSPQAVFSQYRFDVLNTDNGLPQNSVYAILQTRDGYLWFTTLDGLVRYDGARYTVFNRANSKGILSNRFSCLYEDTDGTLWACAEDAGLTRYRDGVFTTFTTEHGLPSTQAVAVRRTDGGELLVMTAGGSARFLDGRFEVIATDPRDPHYQIGTPGPSGNLWYRVGAELRRLRDGQETRYRVPEGGRKTSLLSQVYEDRQGRLW
ncbi:MAG TPA: two-component regulator propeller domain-containing protein, partial [Blastocatellia bacterium]|nr:two-component regulator propeller domain-containing protein [Blastocatellia bacterium]